MSYNARDAQFAGFAKLLFDELYDQFNNLRCQEDDGTYEERDKEAEQTRKNIQGNIASRAYDLVCHACVHVNNEQMSQILGSLHPNAMIRNMPDMIELP